MGWERERQLFIHFMKFWLNRRYKWNKSMSVVYKASRRLVYRQTAPKNLSTLITNFIWLMLLYYQYQTHCSINDYQIPISHLWYVYVVDICCGFMVPLISHVKVQHFTKMTRQFVLPDFFVRTFSSCHHINNW